MNILGINNTHDHAGRKRSAALIVNGHLVASAEERQIDTCDENKAEGKSLEVPAQSVARVLKTAGLQVDDIDHVAVVRPTVSALRRFLSNSIRQPAGLLSPTCQSGFAAIRQDLAAVGNLNELDIRATFHAVKSHDAQLAAAYVPSAFEHSAILYLGAVVANHSSGSRQDFRQNSFAILAAGNGEAIRRHRLVHRSLTEEVVLHLLDELHTKTGETNLIVIADDTAKLVSVERIRQATPFTSIHFDVHTNRGSVGAAFHVWNSVLGRRRVGRECSTNATERTLEFQNGESVSNGRPRFNKTPGYITNFADDGSTSAISTGASI